MDERKFELVSPFKPTGDQPRAIAELVAGLRAGKKEQVLEGATGTGKTFTMANIVRHLCFHTIKHWQASYIQSLKNYSHIIV